MTRITRDRWRVLRLALYYLVIAIALLFAHLTPDYRATPFVYQAF